MKTRENSKCREWEKVRRDNLNKSFAELCKVLPEYDPSKTVKKLDILKKAAAHIVDLQKKLNDVLLEGGVKTSEQRELKLLYERIKKLLLRNEQLSNLLKDASIKIPVEYGDVNKFKDFRRFSHKISPQEAKTLAEKEAQKENKKEENKEKRSKVKSCKKSVQNPNIKKRKKTLKKTNKKKGDLLNVQLSNILLNGANQKIATTLSNQAPSCFIIAGNSTLGVSQPLKCKPAHTVVINSNSLGTPKMASIITPSTSTIVSKSNSSLSSLGPGTLILANGSLVPILPQNSTVFTNPAPILLKPPTNNTTLIVMPSNNSKKSISSTVTTTKVVTSTSVGTRTSYTKTFTPITPKTGLTKTTQVNKLPIPALTSRYSELLVEKSKADIKNEKKVTTNCNISKKVSSNTKSKAVKRKLINSNDTSSSKRVKTLTPAAPPEVLETQNATTENNLVESQAAHKNTVTRVDVSTKSLSADNEPSIENKIDKINDDVDLESAKSISQVEKSDCNNLSKKDEKENHPRELSNEGNGEVFKDTEVIDRDKSDDCVSKDQSKEKDVLKKLDKDKELSKSNLESLNQLIPCDIDSSLSNKSSETKVDKVEDGNIEKQNSASEEKIVKPAKTSEDVSTVAAKTATTTSSASATANLIEINSGPTPTEVNDKSLELNLSLHHSELSNDIFSSLQVPIGGQNPESTSPTAAFLLAFPLVSSLTGVKVTEVIEEENSDSRHGTPNLLQIGTMDTTKTTQSVNSESLTPNLLNLDSFSYFSSKDMCNNFYSSFDNPIYPTSLNSNQLETKQTASCESRKNLDTKHIKVLSESNPQIKHQAFGTSGNLHNISQNTLTSSNPSSITYMEPQVSKTNVMPQHNFVRENASISYAKVSSAQSSYIQDSLRANRQIHYDEKLAATTSASTCKDVNVLNYSTANKKIDLIHTNNQYAVATTNTVSIAQLNAFNPFSDFSKSGTFSKSYGDPLYTNSAHYNYPQHNSNNFEQSYYNSKPPSKVVNTPYVGPTYSEPYNMDCNKSSGSNNNRKRESTNQRQNPTYYPQNKTSVKDKFAHSTKTPKTNNVPKPPINWMTTPDFRPQSTNSEYLVSTPFSKDSEYNPNAFYSTNSLVATTHTTYFNATSSMYTTPDFQNTDNRNIGLLPTNTPQKSDFEENQFAWSPTKLPQFLETPHSFVSSTLPTLVGDLALGTTQTSFGEQKVDHGNKKDTSRRSKIPQVNYDNQTSFLSVSQLVESKTNLDNPSRTNRRNSGTRTVKGSSQKGGKHKVEKELVEVPQPQFNAKVGEKNSKQIQPQNMNYNMQGIAESPNWMPDCNKTNRQVHKNSHNYSAEALIGHQDQPEGSISKQRFNKQASNYSSVNKTIPIPPFLSDNIVPYFTPVEIGQDNNFMQTNLNYQNTFPSSVQNNSYPSTYISTGATITSSYLQPGSLLPEFASHDYSSISDNSITHTPHVMDKSSAKHCNRNEVKHIPNSSRTDHHQQMNADCSANPSNNFIKKTKQKHHNESNMPGIVDLGFLSMPSNINSPTLSDDFHSHSNFLPPPTPSQLFPCKNPLYPKQSADLNASSLLHLPPVPVSRNATQHFENSPLGNTAGTSLTSFNLSAIFPEINKGSAPLPGLYPESSRSKNYNFQKNYLGGPTQQ